MDKFTKIKKDGYILYKHQDGPTIGVGVEMDKHIIFSDGYAFKDLNRNGILDPYEDWRLPIEERVKDLAERMSLEEIAGLMLYSSHQAIAKINPLTLYTGQDEADTRKEIWDLTENQKKFLTEDNLRHVLVAMADDTYAAAKWNNTTKALIPDPRKRSKPECKAVHTGF